MLSVYVLPHKKITKVKLPYLLQYFYKLKNIYTLEIIPIYALHILLQKHDKS